MMSEFVAGCFSKAVKQTLVDSNRMKKALASETHEMPSGLPREEKRRIILSAADKARRSK